MERWIAVGDETGGWDIIDGRFGTEFTGLAWVLGPMSAWESALQMSLGSSTALSAFSRPIGDRLHDGARLPVNSRKYHLLDVWAYCKAKKFGTPVLLDEEQEDPVLELLRQDAVWLLNASGLGVLTAGGSAADAQAAGLGISGDGLRERARAFAGLLTVALPFLPVDSELRLLVEGRTEADIADAVKANRFSQRADSRGDSIRYLEPYRDFIGRLREDVTRSAEWCRRSVSGGLVVSEYQCLGAMQRKKLLLGMGRNFPFLQSIMREYTG